MNDTHTTPHGYPNIIEAMQSASLFGAVRDFSKPSYVPWLTLHKAVLGLHMNDAERAIYTACTGRKEVPTAPCEELWMVIGRRGGKSFNAALLAVALACFKDYHAYLAPGERATIMVIAANRSQARTIMRYIRGIFALAPALNGMVERETQEAFDLNNDVTIEVQSASSVSVRGYTIAAAICDEIAFWATRDEASDPDSSILEAIRPGMASIPGAMLIALSSPNAKLGELWNTYNAHYGVEGSPILVWQAPSKAMNPTLRQSVIDKATERDPTSAAAEYGAMFRDVSSGFISRAVVEQCVDAKVYERSPRAGVRYFAFADPSGGSSDSFTLCIAHRDRDGRVIVDVVREYKPPFSPDLVCQQQAALLKQYGIRKLQGDRYAAEWPVEVYKRHGITYEQSADPKSELYLGFLARLNSGTVRLLDDPRLVGQIAGLRRTVGSSGRETIDHPPRQHDDLANCVAGACAQARTGGYDGSLRWVTGDYGPKHEQHKPEQQSPTVAAIASLNMMLVR
jgi:Terminase large subunit, T4likevirus-type, N-terminal